ncbi:helix-turn-helix domain-containing protein [Salibacterium aidingense]|uniref:helix-turn-helix domain-containing protein n=1 Tax=Salibacterium aidingense TaxID=384933 RepID=UPI003BC3F2C4
MKIFYSEFMKEKNFPFCINRKIHTQENVPPLHAHNFIELVFVVKGEADHIFEGESYTVCAGDVFIINPGEVHTYKITSSASLEIVNCLFLSTLIDDIWLRELGFSEAMDYFYIHPFLNKKERFYHCLNLRGEEAEDIYAQFKRMIDEYEEKKKGYSTVIRFQLMQILIQLSRIYRRQVEPPAKKREPNPERKMLVQRIWGYLERHYDQKVTLSGLAELFNISSRHLNRIFKEATGQTVIEAVHQIRIKRARYLLSQTSEKIIWIAMEVGYEDPAFFTRLFSRQLGCSPGKYRKLSDPEAFIKH